jgi:hypothetical protein
MIPVLVSVFVYVSTLIFLYSSSSLFSRAIPIDYIIVSSFDYFFSILIVFYFLFFYKKRIEQLKLQFGLDYLNIINKKIIFLLPLMVYFLFKAYTSLNLIFYSNATREQLISEYSVTGLGTALFSPVFVILLSYAIVFKVDLLKTALLSLVVLCIMTISASRSEIITITFLMLCMTIFLNDNKHLFKLLLYVIGLVFLAIGITSLLQGRRVGSGINAIYDIFSKFFLYRSFSFFLAEKAIDVCSFEKILYPFFGYASEKILTFIQVPTNPINSKFVLEYSNLGSDHYNNPMLANVLYPWFSWFYGVFGLAGIIIKNAFTFILFHLTLKYKYPMSFIYVFYVTLFVSTTLHPLLTNGGVFYILTVLLIDFLLKREVRKREK